MSQGAHFKLWVPLVFNDPLKAHFLSPGGPKAPQIFFNIFFWIRKSNSLIWYVTLGGFRDFIQLSPQWAPQKPLFGPSSGPRAPKPIFSVIFLLRESNPFVWYVTRWGSVNFCRFWIWEPKRVFGHFLGPYGKPQTFYFLKMCAK